jgi:hypothetical protein
VALVLGVALLQCKLEAVLVEAQAVQTILAPVLLESLVKETLEEVLRGHPDFPVVVAVAQEQLV